MSKTYYILVGVHVESDDGQFEYIFGDYHHPVVAQEKIDVKDSGEYKKLKVIRCQCDSQQAIEAEMALINS